MNRSHLWKLLLILFITSWACFELYPPASRDLLDEFKSRAANVDTNFQAIVKRAEELQAKNPARPYGNLRDAVGEATITNYFPFVDVTRERYASNYTRVVLNQVQRMASGKIKLGLDLQGGTAFLVAMDTNRLSNATDKLSALNQAVEVLRRRVDRFGISEPVIQPAGEERILIQIPGLSEDEKENARVQLQKAAFLEFRMVHPQNKELIEQDLIPPGYEKLMEVRRQPDGREFMIPHLVSKKAERGMTGKYVKRSMVIRDPVSNQPQISFELDSEGAKLFGDITRDNVGRQLAIVLDGELKSAPNINEPIPHGSGVISGSFDVKEAIDLANILENPLQTPVKIIESREVDPSLGKDSISSGVSAALIGTAAVAAFMAVYYMVGGLIACFALTFNIVILLGVMCYVGTTLTLPGIAGIVLTIGMAVDANVLIFERMREELAAGKSLRGAVIAGYDKAFSTIFDSNLTTLIASVLLIYMGTGPVKGFGVTLTIGITVSMFSALVITRLMFDFLLAKNIIKALPMLHLIRNNKWDFMQFAKPAFIISWTIILIGLGYGVYRGERVKGVDFAGGDRMTISFDQTKKVEADKLRAAIEKAKVGDVSIQYQNDIVANKESLQIVTAFEKGTVVESVLQKEFPQTKFQVVGRDAVGPVVGKEIMKTAILSIILAMFGILVYVAFRYEFSFAVGAVLALVHDICMTLGIFFLSGRELSAPIVAAVLTIVGFSINDTIVIFDRIREDLKLGVRGSFREIMNQALNQTLSRTIITSGTVFLATGALYVFGGGVINDFAFTFLVGIVTGTYSSMYIASALVLWWNKGERPKIGAGVTTVDETVAKEKA
jgi:SecD/SecF fusion protein